MLRLLRHPGRLRLRATVVQMEQTGLNATADRRPAVVPDRHRHGFQGADQLRRFGAEIYTVNLLGITILRELGVLLTAIIIAGRSGSAFTAQIGTMQVNEEIDAMRTLGLDPVEVLVLPRVFGLMLTLPLLVFYADALGLLGGCLMTWATLGITLPAFLEQLRGAIGQLDLLGRRHQGAVLRRDHRDGRLLRGVQRVGQRRERRPADDAVGRRVDLPRDRRRCRFLGPVLDAADLTMRI